MKTQIVSDVVADKNIPLDEILNIFEGYGYGKEEMQDFLDSDMTDVSDAFPELKELLYGKKREPKSPASSDDKLDHEVVNDFAIDAIKDNFTPPGAKSQKEDVKDAVDTNDNGEIEVDEMADFQKSLDDYAAKNKKGREDIPATYKR